MPTIPQLLLDRFAATPDAPAIHVKQNGEFQARTWHELQQDIARFAARFSALGLTTGDAVSQFSENRYEWIVADLAMHLLGLIHVPIHSTLAGAQVAEQVTHSRASILLVSTDTLFKKLDGCSLPADVRIFCYEESDKLEPFDDASLAPMELGEIEKRVATITLDSIATILYTSGTTGEPKGVMLSQRNLSTNAVHTNDAINQGTSDLRLCFLPLSHIFARTCDLYTWIYAGAQIALAESRETIVSDAAVLKPSVINGVPYFFSSLKRELEIKGVANQPGMIKQVLGGKLRLCCSGGAALPSDLHEYYESQGTPVLQGYGLTESSPVISVSSLTNDRRGAVGKPIHGVEVMIGDDGEVLTRGDHVMCGYFENEAATNEVIKDGWLHTGDLGSIDEDGFLYITGRKKELIVTATGKNISPSYVESLLVEEPTIAQALVIGDDRKFLSALIVPDQAYIDAHVDDSLDARSLHALMEERVKERLSICGKHEQVAKFTLIDRAFSMELGELTAKLSLRRAVIESNFSSEIEAMYE